MKNSQNRKPGHSGNLLLELMIVVALTVTVSSFGTRMLGEHRELSQELDQKNEEILAADKTQWSAASDEQIEVGGTTIAMTVVQRNW